MTAIPHTFSLPGILTGAKLLCLGALGARTARLAAEACSLKIEHVSPEVLVHQEICRRSPLGRQAGQARERDTAVSDQILLAVLRKWFWARKPDAGFLIEGFPATLLHARVFDEWLDAREETLTGCLIADPALPAAGQTGVERAADLAVVEHYRTLGLLWESAALR